MIMAKRAPLSAAISGPQPKERREAAPEEAAPDDVVPGEEEEGWWVVLLFGLVLPAGDALLWLAVLVFWAGGLVLAAEEVLLKGALLPAASLGTAFFASRSITGGFTGPVFRVAMVSSLFFAWTREIARPSFGIDRDKRQGQSDHCLLVWSAGKVNLPKSGLLKYICDVWRQAKYGQSTGV